MNSRLNSGGAVASQSNTPSLHPVKSTNSSLFSSHQKQKQKPTKGNEGNKAINTPIGLFINVNWFFSILLKFLYFDKTIFCKKRNLNTNWRFRFISINYKVNKKKWAKEGYVCLAKKRNFYFLDNAQPPICGDRTALEEMNEIYDILCFRWGYIVYSHLCYVYNPRIAPVCQQIHWLLYYSSFIANIIRNQKCHTSIGLSKWSRRERESKIRWDPKHAKSKTRCSPSWRHALPSSIRRKKKNYHSADFKEMAHLWRRCGSLLKTNSSR